MRLNLLTLKLFIAVYEEASLTKAAERENIALSALSKRLSDLERALNTTLFHRVRNRLDPTPAASSLAYHARLVMRDLDQLEVELSSFSRGLKGRIRIWANAWAIIQYLPSDLASFMAEHPLLEIEIEESASSAVVQAVTENVADIGIIAGNLPAPGLHVLPYRADRLIVVMPEGHPLAEKPSLRLADIAEYDVIGRKRGSAIDTLFTNAALEYNTAVKPRLRVTGFEAVCRMAEANLGIGLVPEKCVERHMRSMAIAVRPLDEPWSLRQLHLCIASVENLSPAGRLLLGHLRKGTVMPAGEGVTLDF